MKHRQICENSFVSPFRTFYRFPHTSDSYWSHNIPAIRFLCALLYVGKIKRSLHSRDDSYPVVTFTTSFFSLAEILWTRWATATIHSSNGLQFQVVTKRFDTIQILNTSAGCVRFFCWACNSVGTTRGRRYRFVRTKSHTFFSCGISCWTNCG